MVLFTAMGVNQVMEHPSTSFFPYLLVFFFIGP